MFKVSSKFQIFLIWVLFCSSTAFVWTFHEPWGDEADAWLVARDAGLKGILEGAKLRGTPILWYLLQWPFASNNFPYWTQGVLSLVIANLFALLLLYRAPFPLSIRAAVIFSVHYCFEYSVIARNYGLTVLFLTLALILFQRRSDKPILFGTSIGLMSNASFHGFIFAVWFLIAEIIEGVRRRTNIKTALVIIFWTALAAAQIFQLPGESVLKDYYPVSAGTVGKALGFAFVGFAQVAQESWAQVAAFLLSLFITGLIRKNTYALIVWLGGAITLFFLFVFIWWNHRHSGMLFTLALAALWLACDSKHFTWTRRSTMWALASLTLPIIGTIFWAKEEITRPFSASYETANYINQNFPRLGTLAAFRDFPGLAVAPYLPRTVFYYLGTNREGSYALWDRNYYEDLFRLPASVLGRLKEIPEAELVLLSEPLLNPSQYGLSLQFESSADTIVHDRFWVYKVDHS